MRVNRDLHKIESEIYPFTLMFSADANKINNVFGMSDEDHVGGDFGGFTASGLIDGCLVVAIYIDINDDGGIDFANLAHEVYHAVTHVCDHCNLKPCYLNDEQGAYLTTWIFRKCVDSAKKPPAELKGRNND